MVKKIRCCLNVSRGGARSVQRAELNGTLIQETSRRLLNKNMYYIGLDVHKKTISYCVKDVSGHVQQRGTMAATRTELDNWMKTLPQPWTVALEASIFTGWVYDHLLPHAAQVKVAHPLMMRAIAVAKKKNDRIDASKIADCLRCDFLPECHMASTKIRDRRRTLRYRHLLVRQMVQMKNRVSGLLLETGVSHNKERLHQVKYFQELLTDQEVTESIRPLLRLSHETIRRLDKTETALIRSLERDPVLAERINNLKTIPGIGVITALTWALEMDDVSRFRSVNKRLATAGFVATRGARQTKFFELPFRSNETSIFRVFW
jgi:transposase